MSTQVVRVSGNKIHLIIFKTISKTKPNNNVKQLLNSLMDYRWVAFGVVVAVIAAADRCCRSMLDFCHCSVLTIGSIVHPISFF